MLIDDELREFLPDSVAELYKEARTAYMTAYWYPTATREQMLPLCRFMLWSMCNDDLCEAVSANEAHRIHRATVAVLRGHARAATTGIALGEQVEKLHDELTQFLPADSLSRFATHIDQYFDGVHAEITYRDTGTCPTLDDYFVIREKSLMVHAFLDLLEMENQITLPAHILDHPVVQRLESLAVRITAWFNDFQSLDKEEILERSFSNLVKVVQNEFGLNRVDALERALRIHDNDLDEFLRLQSALPDFGEMHDATANYIHRMTFMIAGWRTIHWITGRYQPGGCPEHHVLMLRPPTGGSAS
ncbi:terpene synthase family protein [Streptomyces spectabilis]|uniref:Terpene synthase n=1 Tax=Streptomyces spectabilis TaxID=68270 RepID=A0A7W8B4A1_STRST|nr:terpene synthase family protein [Streptomyces spectabilis]MBB5110073.1 hypothetical protein [Streptomyces spectabilis]